VPPSSKPRAEKVLLRALDLALDRHASVPQLLALVKRAGWALVPRAIEANDGEMDDLVRKALWAAAYHHMDPLRNAYSQVVQYSEQLLEDRFAILHQLKDVAPSDEEREVAAG
jgi:hypothetical protein